jgi:hypothetical protein
VCCVYSLVTGVGKWLPKWDFTSLQGARVGASSAYSSEAFSSEVDEYSGSWEDL